MDASQAKAFELQAQVRHNAETYRNTLNDLYSWEKEIKDKEKELQKQRHLDGGDAESLKTLPIRSHVQQEQKQVIQEALKRATQQAKDEGAWGAETPTEKQDAEPDPVAINRKQANECKDRGNMYVKLSDYTNALIEYTKAIELFPNEAIYYSNRALVYLRLERYDECIEDCNQALTIDSMSVKSYYRRMQANESLGNHMDALKDCTSALMIEPKNAEALRSLDRINERLRKHVKSTNTANFTPERPDLIDISPIEKPAYKRSNKPLKRIKIAEIVTSRADTTGGNLKISDEDIDKLFNSNCGPFVEVKKGDSKVETSEQQSPPKTTAEIVDKVASKADKSMEEPKPKSKAETTSEKATNETQPEAKGAAVAKPQEATEQQSSVEIKSTEKTTPKRPLPPAPTSTAQFYSNWKELTPEQKYHYLKSINLADLDKVLGAGFSSDTLTDIINTLHDYYVPNEEPTTAATLLEVSKNNQIKILSMLMSTEDNTALSRILSSFAHNSNVPESIVKRILHNFNLP